MAGWSSPEISSSFQAALFDPTLDAAQVVLSMSHDLYFLFLLEVGSFLIGVYIVEKKLRKDRGLKTL